MNITSSALLLAAAGLLSACVVLPDDYSSYDTGYNTPRRVYEGNQVVYATERPVYPRGQVGTQIVYPSTVYYSYDDRYPTYPNARDIQRRRWENQRDRRLEQLDRQNAIRDRQQQEQLQRNPSPLNRQQMQDIQQREQIRQRRMQIREQSDRMPRRDINRAPSADPRNTRQSNPGNSTRQPNQGRQPAFSDLPRNNP